MFILLNALVASLDGLIIGIGLKLSRTKLTLINKIVFLLTNILIYTFIIIIYYHLHIKFMTTPITTLLYLFLAWSAYKNKENEAYEQKLKIEKNILLAATHSIDGSIVSLNFVYNYNIIYIITIFSIASILLLIIGYKWANSFKNIKKSNLITALLFILLALINLIF